ASQFNLHSRIGCYDPGPAHPSKAFPHAFEKTRLIVAPLILIITANKIGHCLPVSVVNSVKEIFGVQPDLMLSSPKPEQIQADKAQTRKPANECSTKCNRHRHEFIFRENSGHWAGWVRLRFLEGWLDRFLYLHLTRAIR